MRECYSIIEMTPKDDLLLAKDTQSRLGVLIVDDTEEVRRDLRMVLELDSDLIILGEAMNGEEAVLMAEELKPDLVLMDLRLPGLDGCEATKQIKARGLAKGVIMLTIYGQQENRQRAANSGVDLFMEKGIGIEALIAALKRVGKSWPDNKTEK